MQPTEKKQGAVQQSCAAAPQPTKEHAWLHQMIGEWTCQGEAAMQPGEPTVSWSARETVRSVGGLWVIGEGTGDTPDGGTSQTVITLGYDPQSQRFTGTFVASMMTHLWIYDGELDAGGTVLTLIAEGPGMTPDVPRAKYRDIVEMVSPDERTLASLVLAPDGEWKQIMKATYKRS